MHRARNIVGIVAGTLIAISSVPHGLVGWPALREALQALKAPADLVLGLSLGWYLGTVTILAFGAIALTTFVRRLRGNPVTLVPARIVAIAYIVFGGWSMAIVGLEGHFFIAFLLPGLLMAFASFTPETGTA